MAFSRNHKGALKGKVQTRKRQGPHHGYASICVKLVKLVKQWALNEHSEPTDFNFTISFFQTFTLLPLSLFDHHWLADKKHDAGTNKDLVLMALSMTAVADVSFV